jgi:hypothetical protein
MPIIGKNFFRAVFMRVQRSKLDNQPRMNIAWNACQVWRKDASAPRQLALAQPDFGKTPKSVSKIEAVNTQAGQQL